MIKPYYEEEGITIYCADCRDVLPHLEPVDLVITDPPYGIGKEFENDKLPLPEYINWLIPCLDACKCVLKYGGALWITLGWQTVAEVKTALNTLSELRLKNWVIWYRQDGWKGDRGFSQSHEHLLYYIKDNLTPELHNNFIEYLNQNRQFMGLSLSDINQHFGWASSGGGCASSYMGNKIDNFLPTQKHYDLLKDYLGLDGRFDSLPFGVKFNKCDISDDLWLKPKSEKKRLGHPTQKPIALMARPITVSTDIGDLILDSFMGSGTTLVAAKQLGRKAIGIEIEEKYCAIAVERLRQGVLKF